MDKIGINLQIRSMENNIVQSLEQFPDVPIEVKRIILEKILEKITRDADIITEKEMETYKAKEPPVPRPTDGPDDDCH